MTTTTARTAFARWMATLVVIAAIIMMFFVTLATSASEEVEFVKTLIESRRSLLADGGDLPEEHRTHRVLKTLLAFELHDFTRHSRLLGDHNGVEEPFTYELELFGRRLRMQMEPHRKLFSPNYAHVIFGKAKRGGRPGEMEELSREGPTKCHFKAKVEGDDDYRGVVSLCMGTMHATFHHAKDDDKSFTIQPMELESSSTHVAYLHNDMKPTAGECGLNHNNLDKHTIKPRFLRARTLEEASSSRSLVGVADKTVAVLVVNDHARYTQYSQYTHVHAAQLFSVVEYLYSTLPSDSTYKINIEIYGMYTFATEDPWTNSLSASGAVTADDLLTNFLDFSESAPRPDDINGPDTAHLLSGVPFVQPVIGLAKVGGVCVVGNRAAVVQANNLADAQISSTSTHEIGHNLGMHHTDDPLTPPSCDPAPDGKYYIMAASQGGTPNVDWDPCSIAWLTHHFDTEYTNPECVETPTLGAGNGDPWVGGYPVCGDGLTEGDEECDCPEKDCTGLDICCDGHTCKLKKIPDGYSFNASCSQQDACCTVVESPPSCTVVTDTSVTCRDAINECDVAETCDGVSGRCPADEAKATGATCHTENFDSLGICFFKKCHSHIEQCKNVISTLSGPCDGYGDGDGDAGCGYAGGETVGLKCEQGGICQTFTVNGKDTTIPVETGTPCGTGKACYLTNCVDYSEIPDPTNINCTNGVRDQNETDIDCGGQCFACGAGKACMVDKNCIYPSTCNMTEVDDEGYGKCTSVGRSDNSGSICFPTCPAVVEEALQWMRDNPQIWAPILGVVAIALAMYCFWPTGDGQNRAVKGVRAAHGSFRNLTSGNSFRGMYGGGGKAEDLPVAVPAP